MTNKLAVSSVFFKEPTKTKWESAIEAGIKHVELCFSHEFDVSSFLTNAQDYYEMLSSSGLIVSSVHLPFGTLWDISALDDSIRKNALEELKKLLDWLGEKNIKIGVLHPSYEPIGDEERSQRLKRAAESIKILAAYAKDKGISLAIENLPRTCLGNCADEMLILTHKGKNAGICLDVNHLLIESHKDFIEKVGPYIITTHLSDYDGIDERHWLVGEGCIDWPELIGLLRQQEYQGRFLFELNEQCVPSTEQVLTLDELVSRFIKISQ